MTIAPFEFAVDFRRPACHAENCLCSLADAGQTRHTRTRVVKFTLASVGDERATSRSETHNTLRAIITLLGKWLSPLLVGRGALSCGLVPTSFMNFGVCELREATMSISA